MSAFFCECFLSLLFSKLYYILRYSKDYECLTIKFISMSKLVIQKGRDGYSVFFDDYDERDFTRLGKAYGAEYVGSDKSCVITYNKDGAHKKLYAIKNSKIFEAELPGDCEVLSVSGGGIAVLQGDYYYSVGRDEVQKTVGLVLLGKDINLLGISYPCTIVRGTTNWNYFLQELCHDLEREGSKSFEIAYFVNGEPVFFGPYREFVESSVNGMIFAKRYDHHYDALVPNSADLWKGEFGAPIQVGEMLFVWHEYDQGWWLYEGYKSWGKNAMYRIVAKENGTNEIELFEICPHSIICIDKGEFSIGEGFISIDELTYYLDENTQKVDFDNPKGKLTLWQRILKIFR